MQYRNERLKIGFHFTKVCQMKIYISNHQILLNQKTVSQDGASKLQKGESGSVPAFECQVQIYQGQRQNKKRRKEMIIEKDLVVKITVQRRKADGQAVKVKRYIRPFQNGQAEKGLRTIGGAVPSPCVQQALTGLQLPVDVHDRCDGDILRAGQLVDEAGEEAHGGAGDGPEALLALIENGGRGPDLCGVGDFGEGREGREWNGSTVAKTAFVENGHGIDG